VRWPQLRPLGHLGELHGHGGHVVEGDHELSGMACTASSYPPVGGWGSGA
jgi:hypothetical protein